MLRRNPASPRELIDDLDLAFTNRRISEDARNTAIVAIGFAELLRSAFDDFQKEALDVAKRFWFDGDEDGYNDHLVKFSRIVDADQKVATSSNMEAKNRIIWASLNRNTKFNGYAAEFLVLMGEKAGLTVQQMRDVIAACISDSCTS
jgi:hypothetical protein